MKKVIAGITMMLLVSSTAVYAGGGGKKKAKKAARKTECCTNNPCCCDKSKCNSADYAVKVNTAEAKVSENEKQEGCVQQSSCTKKD